MKETYNRAEFEMWVLNHKLHLLLGPKEREIFLNNNMRFQDLKLFGQLENAELLTREWLTNDIDKQWEGMINPDRTYWIDGNLKLIHDFTMKTHRNLLEDTY
jgi:hypothetical protein